MKNSIHDRVAFYELDASDGRLQKLGRKLDKFLDSAISRFYAKIQGTPHLAAMFSGGQQIARAKSAQKTHWQKLFSQGLNDAYLERSKVIGEVHARIDLKPKWYIGGYSLILDETIHALIAPGVQRFLPGRKRLAEDVSLLVRASLLDMDIALSTYFDRNEQNIHLVIESMSKSLARLAEGDLTTRMSELPSEFAQAEKDFNTAMESLQETMLAVISGVQSMSTASAEIRAASDDLANRNEQQAASLEETAAAMNQVTGIVKETAGRVIEVQRSISAAHEEATDGGKVVEKATAAMGEIETSSQEISQIISVIDGIAFQTNLLALNAGVEAARAGDAGKGFAVVANEVRALAQRSADAAKDIKDLITNSSKQVTNGVKLVGETGELLTKIVGRVGEVSASVDEIAVSAETQSTNLTQVNLAVGRMDTMTQQNAAMVEESTAAARSLANESQELTELVSTFRTSEGGTATRPSLANDNARGNRTGTHG
ncbi:methyl-accepting chemotaxis protein [Croceicoccus sp. YJ47]|uniref:methyl-accepting chemotaxis protein n=1 Tax=Croceicoccus sp. YJ47 TaxID=2798724 RepID=UPI001921370C|nr:methyl-accepting chemotaxis protein [Croceicoccus sp. YJ47]QQN73379.1 globin-coupled sensor protein [Croceicoccus sp. YJ47]